MTSAASATTLFNEPFMLTSVDGLRVDVPDMDMKTR